MKILFINTIDNVGGAAMLAWNLGRELSNRGHEVKYIVGFKKSDSENVYQLKKNCFFDFLTKISGKDINFVSRGFLTAITSNDIDYGAEDEILNHPWYKEADVIHCHNLHGRYMKLKTLEKMCNEKKVIWTLHDEWAIMPHGSYSDKDLFKNGFFYREKRSSYPFMIRDKSEYLIREKRRIYERCLNLKIAIPSKWMEERVSKSVLGNKKVCLIYNGIESDNFILRNDKDEIRKKLELPLEKKIILFVADSGKYNPRKGWIYAEKVIEYFSGDPNILFVCIGGKNKKESLIDNVLYVSYISDREILAAYYSASDLYLFTSLAESFGLIIVEAVLSGLPVLGFPVGIVNEIINHKENGYIAKYEDSDDLIEGAKFLMALNQKTKSDIFLKNDSELREKFSIKKMSDEYLKLYDK